MSALLRSCTRMTSPGQNVSWSFTGCHCVSSGWRTSTFPSTAIALATDGSHVAENDVAGENMTVRMPAQTMRPEQVAHRFAALSIPIADLISHPECVASFDGRRVRLIFYSRSTDVRVPCLLWRAVNGDTPAFKFFENLCSSKMVLQSPQIDSPHSR